MLPKDLARLVFGLRSIAVGDKRTESDNLRADIGGEAGSALEYHPERD